MVKFKRLINWRKCPHCGITVKLDCKKCPDCGEYLDECWEELSKTERNEKIVKSLDTGDYTLAEVGENFDISRQRVHQIYKRLTGHNYRARIKKDRKKRVKEKAKKKLSLKTINKYCMGCGRPLKESWRKSYRKKQMTGKPGKSRKFCYRCRRISQNKRDPKITFTCAYCGDEFHPFYNWRWSPGTPKFCSRDCYHKSMKVGGSFKESYETLPVFSKLHND